MSFDDMTIYEQAAWRQSIQVIYTPGRALVPSKYRDDVARWTSKAGDKIKTLPGMESTGQIVEKAFNGTLALVFQPAMRSASPDRTVKLYAKKYPQVRTYDDVRTLPLQQRDKMLPSKLAYTVASAGQGGATSLAVTGSEIATSVSGGTTAAVAIGAIAADSVISLAMMGRSIGAVAVRYGYDVSLPDEELFAMGVLSLGLAGSFSAKTQAVSALSKLTQEMMRRATWKKLQEHVLVRAISSVYKQLGLRLTQRKLAQTVPIVGVGINAALTANLTEQTFRRAQAVYRLRSLSETYEIDPKEWLRTTARAAGNQEDSSENVVDIMDALDAEENKEE